MRAWAGHPHPLGATWDGQGTNFALYSRHATGVRLCLFDEADDEKAADEIRLEHRTQFVWHVYLPDVRPPQLYGYRVEGPWSPSEGHRFNPAKLLVDPYARAITGRPRQPELLRGHATGEDGAGFPDERDSARFVPKSVVVNPTFPWRDDTPPRTPWSETVLYECHVKGMTALHPDIPERLRGTYAGLACEPILEHWRALGVTAVELLPIHQVADEPFLHARGLTNYWGYSTLGYFAPDARYASGARGDQVLEFKGMVRALHRVGIEVILDVVYNHTCEGGADGPTLSFRGIDNATYYQLDPRDPSRYLDYSGCGNALAFDRPAPLRLLLDSLRYWVRDMHVDGFRFDLAPALARHPGGFESFERFFGLMQQDPFLARAKLVAEPWDLGPDGYRLGGFPPGFVEWNDQYRDAVRRFWRGDRGHLGEFVRRISGSEDRFGAPERGPLASVGFVTAHDGFSLRDWVSYEQKHNEPNGENNADGHEANYSLNCGVEGPSARHDVELQRLRLMKCAIATLALSQGVPMLSHGDEIGHTKRGNNNAYCQDNDINWLDWSLEPWQRELLDFCRKLLALRAATPALRRRRPFRGEPAAPGELKDVTWLRTDGREISEQGWHDERLRSFAMLIGPRGDPPHDPKGRPVGAAPLLIVFNPRRRSVVMRVPEWLRPARLRMVASTCEHSPTKEFGARFPVPPRTVCVLRVEGT